MSATVEQNWVTTFERGIDYIADLDGVSWTDAPRPRRFHRCFAQTKGFVGLSFIERCPCGAIKLRGRWSERNLRRNLPRRRSS